VGRGLGEHQRDVMIEIATMERDGLSSSKHGFIAVSALFTRVWQRKWRARYDADTAAYEAARIAELEQVKVRAASGDADAQRTLRSEAAWDTLCDRLRRRAERRAHIGSPRRRGFPDRFERDINPSRILSSLERRGFIQRHYKHRGHGSVLQITDAGRKAAEMQPEAAGVSP
jgi:hypothetical protein